MINFNTEKMKKSKLTFITVSYLLFFVLAGLCGQHALSPADLLSLKYCSGPEISPDGTEALYAISVPRGPNEEPGPASRRVMRLSLATGITTSLFDEDFKGSSPQWSPDGKRIAFLHQAKDEKMQVWSMPAEGGEMTRLTDAETGVYSFMWNPDGTGLAYLSLSPDTEREKELKKRGYDFIYFEENLKNRNLYLVEFKSDGKIPAVRQLTDGVQVWSFIFNNTGNRIAAAVSPKNLVDHSYMFTRIFLVDIKSGTIQKISENEGKLGNFAFSPDDRHIAYTAALHINDHAVSQVYVKNLDDGNLKNLTPHGFKGHVSWVNWKNNQELLYYSEEGVWPKLNLVGVKGGERKIILDSEHSGIVFNTPKYTPDFKHFIFTASSPSDPGNIYYWNGKGAPERKTDINPGMAGKKLGKQEVIGYNARDGLRIEGILIRPVDYNAGTLYPLIVYVHGGPEAHHSNNWLSRYSTPGQVMAGKGYMVLYLNYRASTGYGVDFAMEGFMDPAGKEFDDIADGIEYVIKEKGADPDRVGLAGGSYGGYASAWFATYYTEYVRAVCMFVGISNLISKKGTTDIPYEELYVHSGKKLEEQWQMNLERSPIYWAHQSKTATLIYGGAADTRVHPSQSMELYRRMKMNDHPAVRLVQYPGEGHGNRNQVGQIDVLHRQIGWFDWYVRDLNPLDGPMPPLEIADEYGLDW